MKVRMNCAQIETWSQHFWGEMSTVFGSSVNNESDGGLFFKLPCIVIAKLLICKCRLNVSIIDAIDVKHHLGAILVAIDKVIEPERICCESLCEFACCFFIHPHHVGRVIPMPFHGVQDSSVVHDFCNVVLERRANKHQVICSVRK